MLTMVIWSLSFLFSYLFIQLLSSQYRPIILQVFLISCRPSLGHQRTNKRRTEESCLQVQWDGSHCCTTLTNSVLFFFYQEEFSKDPTVQLDCCDGQTQIKQLLNNSYSCTSLLYIINVVFSLIDTFKNFLQLCK